MSKTPAKETKAQILERTEREKVKFLRLQFTDILGTIKNVEIPDRQFEDALDGPLDVPRLPVAGDDRREGRADDLRHLHARR